MVIVEAKIGDWNTANPLHAAYEQLLRYRNGRSETIKAGLREGEPRLFHTNLVVVRTCGERAEFGTISAEHEHFYAWKDIWPERNRSYEPPLGVEREQEKLVQGLLAPSTLLHMLRTCTVFMDTDSGRRIKVVARYQQYRAARKIADRLRKGATPEKRSGVVWHTQGSGKSLTMVFVARMFARPRICRTSRSCSSTIGSTLEEQLAQTARLIGGKINLIDSTARLREHLAHRRVGHQHGPRAQVHGAGASGAGGSRQGGGVEAGAVQQDVRHRELVRAHHPDDRRGPPHPGVRSGRQLVRGLSERDADCLHRHTANHRAARGETHGEALRRVHRHLQADGRRAGRGHPADPLRGSDSGHGAS